MKLFYLVIDVTGLLPYNELIDEFDEFIKLVEYLDRYLRENSNFLMALNSVSSK